MSQNGAAGNPSDAQDEALHYAMLGADTAADAEKLKKYTGVVGWDYLKPHFDSDALLYVDPTLELTEVGAAVSADDSAKVEGWLKSGDLVKPGPPHADYWVKSKQEFAALVVSPFVLIQPAPDNG